MKIMKKLIAVISSLAMVATMASSMVVHATNGNPTVKLVLTEAASEIEGAYDLSVRIDPTRTTTRRDKVLTFAIKLAFDSEIFDTTSADAPTYWEYVDPEYPEDGVTYPNVEAMASVTGDVVYENNTLTFSRNNPATATAVITAETNIVTFKNVKLADGVTTDDVKIDVVYLTLGLGNTSTNLDMYKYVGTTGEALGAATELVSADMIGATFPGNKTDDGGDDTPTITKVGSYADGENDKAVAYMLETTAVAGNTVTATGTITFADDTTKPATLKPQSVNANVETNGAVALGIIVQFDGTWKDFVITEMAIN